MTLAVLLSGQGGQHPGMFDLTAALPEAQGVFAAAAPLLGQDPRDLVRSGKDLHANRIGQILCCVAGLAAWTLVRRAQAARVVVVGYSIGDLAAFGCAGLFAPETVLHLAAARAEAMDAAAGPGYGLAGLRGLPAARAFALAEAQGCHPAIRNAADSVVVGGPVAALDALCAQALAAGAARAVRLPVHIPSHTPLLAEASARFAERLAQAPLATPPRPAPRLLSGLDGAAVFRPEAGLPKLAAQVAQTLDWAACLEGVGEFGATRVLELGPGHALATMARAALPEARVHALEDFRQPAGVVQWIRDGA
ncbi:acyl transferase [Methylobacterium sp. Leaf465]|uniref:acyltransferase domain-containing protein n=1 Tax=unclassified Methylobacterium TaxID=2615210 RepID=UPI0006F25919|nr:MULTISPECIES: acyltransferase domain-containing protein [unclassified Methylobacterium]KQT69354.1 acyl transferase [Methylobacterium sp. Leaf465]KQU24456.1 acyl transferase [Methylobacterium sp. Leaf94]